MKDKSSSASFLAGFQRITSTGKFLPEIDGLRFVAIASVLLFHLDHYLSNSPRLSFRGADNPLFDGVRSLAENGWRGVEFFFVISGFILARPFAAHFIQGGKKVSLQDYFIRRVTRLEPPYIIVLLIGLALILIHGGAGVGAYFQDFLGSLFYSHNFLAPRGTLPAINPVTWSLEIEIQFYIVAPLIGYLYLLGRNSRRVVLIFFILIAVFGSSSFELPHVSLLDFLGYFLLGFLFADLHVSGELETGDPFGLGLLGAILSGFVAIWGDVNWLILPLGVFWYCTFKSAFLRKILGNPWVATIGGMCYSIYLLHWLIIVTLGGKLVTAFTANYLVDYFANAILLLTAIMLLSALFFKMVERPCMDKNWPVKLWDRSAKLWKTPSS